MTSIQPVMLGYSFEAPFLAAAFFAAHRFLSAATIAALPSALSFRLGFGALVGAPLDSPFFAAHRFRCASAIAFRPATLIFHLPRFDGSDGCPSSAGAPVNIARRSAMWESILRFCSSKPRMAAFTTSFESFGSAIWCPYILACAIRFRTVSWGCVLWGAVLQSGMHATIASVQAMTIPSRIVLAPFVFLRHSRYAHGHFENAARAKQCHEDRGDQPRSVTGSSPSPRWQTAHLPRRTARAVAASRNG
jgi:hypothetical protein